MANALFEPSGLLSFGKEQDRNDSPHFTPPPEMDEPLSFESELAMMEADEADLQRDVDSFAGSQNQSQSQSQSLGMEIDEDGPVSGLSARSSSTSAAASSSATPTKARQTADAVEESIQSAAAARRRAAVMESMRKLAGPPSPAPSTPALSQEDDGRMFVPDLDFGLPDEPPQPVASCKCVASPC